MKKYILIIFLSSLFHSGYGQTVRELLKLAEANYPLLKAKGYEVQAGKDQVSFAKSSILPSLDAAYQINYVTYNNITGMAVGQSFVPISGPPSSENTPPIRLIIPFIVQDIRNQCLVNIQDVHKTRLRNSLYSIESFNVLVASFGCLHRL